MNDDHPKLHHLNQISPTYCRLMEEIKQRVGVVRNVVDGRVAVPQIVASEICHIQLRKICELIAIACVVAHGDLKGVKAGLIQKSYQPDRILKALEKLHRDFYPLPFRQEGDQSSGKARQTESIKDGFLSKDGLMRLYGACGDQLHRGSVRRVLAGREETIDFAKTNSWLAQITTLLNCHRIKTSHPEWELWILMQAQDTRVHAYTMKAIGGNPSA